MSYTSVKWEKADKYHKNDNYNSPILEWGGRGNELSWVNAWSRP